MIRQSNRSGCPRLMRANSGWKLNQPAVAPDLGAGELGHLRVGQDQGVSAASAIELGVTTAHLIGTH